MTANYDVQMREELLIRRYVDEKLDEVLILNIQQLLKTTRIQNNRRMGRSQFSGLQNVARDTASVQVILNWLRYQIGRQASWRDGDFGPKLLNILDETLYSEAKNIAEDIIKENEGYYSDKRTVNRLLRKVWLMLIRQYVGQLQRAVLGYQETK